MKKSSGSDQELSAGMLHGIVGCALGASAFISPRLNCADVRLPDRLSIMVYLIRLPADPGEEARNQRSDNDSERHSDDGEVENGHFYLVFL
jgi:hypothetical protein